MNTSRIALIVSFFATLAGCTHGARLTTPSGFATLEEGETYTYRATSAQGVVLATRTEPNAIKANTRFWAEALDAKLRDKGYTPDGAARDVKTAKGLKGAQLRYHTLKSGREHRYWITVFTTESKVYLVEAAGDNEPFDASTQTLENAIASLDAS